MCVCGHKSNLNWKIIAYVTLTLATNVLLANRVTFAQINNVIETDNVITDS